MSQLTQKIVIGTLVHILTNGSIEPDRDKQVEAHIATLKYMLPQEFFDAPNFYELFLLIAKTSVYFCINPNIPGTVHLNWCSLGKVAEMLEQYHNYYAAVMERTNKNFEFLDKMKHAVSYAKFLRDKTNYHVPMCSFNFGNFTTPQGTLAQPPTMLPRNHCILECAFNQGSRIPPQVLPMSTLLSPLGTAKSPYNNYTQVGFFE